MECNYNGSKRTLTFNHAELVEAVALISGQEISTDVTLHVYDRKKSRRLAVHRSDDQAVYELHFAGDILGDEDTPERRLDTVIECSEAPNLGLKVDNSITKVSGLGYKVETKKPRSTKKKVAKRKASKKKG